MGTSVHPFILIAIAATICAFGAIVVACVVKNKIGRSLLILLALILTLPGIRVLLAFRPELIDARFRTYKAFYRDISIGMTTQDLYAVMNRHYPSTGPRRPPVRVPLQNSPDQLGFFMDPEGSREPNCEGIFLTLTNGSVTHKNYSPD